MSMKPRVLDAYECSHLRPVVLMRTDASPLGRWYHIWDGEVAGECAAGVYKVQATFNGQHYVTDLDRREVES